MIYKGLSSLLLLLLWNVSYFLNSFYVIEEVHK